MAGFDVQFLPREEPGNPLTRVSPDFTDRVMVHIRAERRRHNRRRMVAIVRAGIGVIAVAWLAVRPLSGPVHYDNPVAQVRPHPAVPRAQIAHVQPKSRPEAQVVVAPSRPKPAKHDQVVPSKPEPTREEILAGRDAGKIFELAWSEKDVEKKMEAIRVLAAVGNDEAGLELVALYAGEPDPAMRRVIFEGIVLQHKPALIDIVAKMGKDSNRPIPVSNTIGSNPFAGTGNMHLGHADITVTPKPDTAETTTSPPKKP